jgi:hypothetical protein
MAIAYRGGMQKIRHRRSPDTGAIRIGAWRVDMNASTLSFRSAVCLGIIGMAAGIAMAASGNHAPMPAHAHLNLLGWVSLFLIGIFYRLHPSLDSRRVAFWQVAVWIVGTIVLSCGVAAIYMGRPDLEGVAVIGSLIVLADMLLFAWLVFRPEPAASRLAGAASPAE